MKSIWTNSTARITGFESTHAFSPQPAVPHDVKMLAHTRKLQLADPKDHTDDMNLPIEIVIGGDHYWKVVKDSSPIRISPTVVLIPSKFGWILSGLNNCELLVHPLRTCPSYPDDFLRKFWDLETLGIRENRDLQRSSKDSAIIQAFEDSYLIEEQRRVRSLPRKEGIIPPTNRYNAQRRFHNLEKRLQGNAHLKEIYYTQMMDYIVKGHVKLVALGSQPYDEFYLPRQLVKKEKRGKTKWRIVFDASAREADGPSLNDSLEMGPNLLPEILSILLRFRTYRTAIIGDIAQAFLQLKLDRKDRDLTRFFWYNITKVEGKYEMTNDVTIYRFTRLPFVLTCSLFLLSAALRKFAYLHKSTFPSAASLIDNSTFMDDFVAGGENDNQVISLYYELTQLMNIFSVPMAKWATNSEKLRCIWEAEDRKIDTDTQVLVGRWNTSSDTFYIDHRDITETLLEGLASKRQILRVTSRFYDILGLLTPISITGKLLFQGTWCRGMAWDELLPHDLGTHWHMWISSLSELSQIRIPRWIGTSERYIHQLHVLCDASERAYGAVIYVRSTKDDCVSVSLACSKNRLAPVKKATGHDTSEATVWTDWTVTLGWIRSDPNRWKTFFSNRVTEIQTLTTPSQWRHCPAWVLRFLHNVRGNEKYTGELTATELRNSRTYWIQVAQRHCFPAELQALENRLPLPKESKIVRFNPLLEDGLIHLGGRLQFADRSREQLHPLLLDGSHPFVQLLIRETHIRLHHLGVRIVLSELRSEFWILRARQPVKKILRTCLPCKMAHNHLGQAIEAPLPGERVTPQKPHESISQTALRKGGRRDTQEMLHSPFHLCYNTGIAFGTMF
ncbi:hypothetical protein ANN_17778 [Periplaneta americana]|uniref:Integrase zinc-binding domain-containing protein n=1 Tax=Periplaneta americana TaxID=6978 RepID=A0ABQ8SUH3_PERAM|nr:hypothetical protein ANN_17778 [Periplaneta americana]